MTLRLHLDDSVAATVGLLRVSVHDVQRLISDRVRHERRRLGLTQVVFAARCGIALHTYKRLELGKSDSIGALIRVAQYLWRAAGFDMLFPSQPRAQPLRGPAQYSRQVGRLRGQGRGHLGRSRAARRVTG